MNAPSTVICAAPGCDNVVVRRPGAIGRPPIYCSPACRPTPTTGAAHRILVEVDHDEPDDTGTGAGRSWVVRLRRGQRTVIIGHNLGRFSATALSNELRRLLQPLTRQEGDTND